VNKKNFGGKEYRIMKYKVKEGLTFCTFLFLFFNNNVNGMNCCPVRREVFMKSAAEHLSGESTYREIQARTVVQLLFAIYFYMHTEAGDTRDWLSAFPWRFKELDLLEGDTKKTKKSSIMFELSMESSGNVTKVVKRKDGTTYTAKVVHPYLFCLFESLNYIFDCYVKKILCATKNLSEILFKTFFMLENLAGAYEISGTKEEAFINTLLSNCDNRGVFILRQYNFDQIANGLSSINNKLLQHMLGSVFFGESSKFSVKNIELVNYWMVNQFKILSDSSVRVFLWGNLSDIRKVCQRIIDALALAPKNPAYIVQESYMEYEVNVTTKLVSLERFEGVCESLCNALKLLKSKLLELAIKLSKRKVRQ
jgi:hypothetical protein